MKCGHFQISAFVPDAFKNVDQLLFCRIVGIQSYFYCHFLHFTLLIYCYISVLLSGNPGGTCYGIVIRVALKIERLLFCRYLMEKTRGNEGGISAVFPDITYNYIYVVRFF